MVITSPAAAISSGNCCQSCLPSSAFTTEGWPTSTTRTPSSRAASTLPSTSGRGAWSPPIASTAIVIMESYCRRTGNGRIRLGRGVFDGLALVIAAVRASLVRLLHFVAVGALAQGRLGQMVVRPPGAGPPLRMAPFWIWHGTSPSLYLEREEFFSCRVHTPNRQKTEIKPNFTVS